MFKILIYKIPKCSKITIRKTLSFQNLYFVWLTNNNRTYYHRGFNKFPTNVTLLFLTMILSHGFAMIENGICSVVSVKTDLSKKK